MVATCHVPMRKSNALRAAATLVSAVACAATTGGTEMQSPKQLSNASAARKPPLMTSSVVDRLARWSGRGSGHIHAAQPPDWKEKEATCHVRRRDRRADRRQGAAGGEPAPHDDGH